MKALKIFFMVLLVTVVLFVFLTVMLNVFFKPEFMRNHITRIVSEKIHREVSLKGNLSWSLFPRIKLSATHLELGNPEGFVANDPSFVTVQRLDLGLGLLPLLTGKVVVNHLAVDGMVGHFVVDRNGHKNWEMAPASVKQNDTANSPPVVSNKPINLEIQSVALTNSHFSYEDISKKQKIMLDNVNVRSTHIAPAQPFDFSVSTAFDLGGQRSGQMNMTSEVLFQPDLKQIQLGNLQIQSQINMPSMKPVKLVISGQILADVDKQHLALTEFDGKIDAVHVSGELETNYQGDTPVVLAKLKVDPFDPKRIFAIANQPFPVFQSSSAMNQISAKFELQATPNSLLLNKLQLTLDNSMLTGAVGVTDFAKKIFQFGLSLDQLDLNQYKMKSVGSMPAKTSPAVSSRKTSPAAVKGWGGVGSISVGSLKLADMILNNTQLSVLASQGIYTINPIKTYVYGGSYIGQLTLNSVTSSVSAKGALMGVDVQSLAKDLSPITQVQLTGKADINHLLSTRGNSLDECVRNLNGNMLFVLKNGVLKGIDVPYYYALGKSLLNSKQALTQTTNTNQTEFGTLSGSMLFNQGVATNNDLLLQGPVFQAKGQGDFDLVNQRINYQLTISASALTDQSIPLKITGPFNKVSILPDVEVIAKEQLKQQAKKQLQGKVSDYLEKKVGKDAASSIVEGLGGLLQKQ
ncbi:MAG: AsmA family protein [Gammaproteobacteria bacterium]|nr:AsmA family protein [Gammaproteobacteria bacterium]